MAHDELAQALQEIVDGYAAEGLSGAVLMVDLPDIDFTWKVAAAKCDDSRYAQR